MDIWYNRQLAQRTFRPTHSSANGHFTPHTVRLTDHSANGHFAPQTVRQTDILPQGQFSKQTIRQTIISPKGQFGKWTIDITNISPNGHLCNGHFVYQTAHLTDILGVLANRQLAQWTFHTTDRSANRQVKQL